MDKPLSTPMDKNKQREVVQALIEFLPKSSVLFELEAVKPYECDALPAYRQLPMVVAIPENEHEVQSILRTCHRLGVIVVARGAGTGLSGGAMPCDQGVLLSLAKMMRIKSIDPHARTATVEPGVRNLAISEAA
ncbi:MAG: FAD-binding protein, partial [Betaproteobacteria bacterium]